MSPRRKATGADHPLVRPGRVSEPHTVNLHDAKTWLPEPVDRAHDGEEIVIAKARTPMARLVPFDRLLAAQAMHEGLTLVTHDRAFAPYALPVRWA